MNEQSAPNDSYYFDDKSNKLYRKVNWGTDPVVLDMNTTKKTN